MKQFKPVIICAVVLLVIAAVAFSVTKLFPEVGNGTDTPSMDELFGSSIRIIEREASDIASVEVKTSAGESFAIDYSEDDLGLYVATMRDADPRLAYGQTGMTNLLSYLGRLTALEEIGTGEDGDFGFDKPQRTIKINYKDGESETLLLGSAAPLGNGTYVRTASRDTVYTVGGTTAAVLMQTRGDYRDVSLFSSITSTDVFESVTVSHKGKSDIIVSRKADAGEKPTQEPAASLWSNYALKSPVVRDADLTALQNELFDKICDIKGESLVEDYPKDLAKYGLENPVHLKFQTEQGNSASLLIGAKAPTGGRYVMPEGVPTVIVTEKDIDLTRFSHIDIVMKLLWFNTAENVDTITYELSGGEKHTLKLEVKDGTLYGEYDGGEITKENATNLFLHTISFEIAGEVSADMSPKGEPIMLSMKLGSKKTTTLKLSPADERRYIASVDGGRGEYYVAVAEVRELLNCFELLSQGKDIPDMF